MLQTYDVTVNNYDMATHKKTLCNVWMGSIDLLKVIQFTFTLKCTLSCLFFFIADPGLLQQQLKTEGLLWFPDLTVPESFVIPVLLALVNLTLIEVGTQILI